MEKKRGISDYKILEIMGPGLLLGVGNFGSIYGHRSNIPAGAKPHA